MIILYDYSNCDFTRKERTFNRWSEKDSKQLTDYFHEYISTPDIPFPGNFSVLSSFKRVFLCKWSPMSEAALTKSAASANLSPLSMFFTR